MTTGSSGQPLPAVGPLNRPETGSAEAPDAGALYAALAELVRLKDGKDRDGETADYRARKDRAWAEARRWIRPD